MAPETAGDKLAKSARGEDEPLDAHKPSVPFALVWGAYPIILVLALLGILAAIWLLRPAGS